MAFQKGVRLKGIFAEACHALLRMFRVLFVQSFQGGLDGLVHAYSKVVDRHFNGILPEQGGMFQPLRIDEQGQAPEKIFTGIDGTAAGAGFQLPVETRVVFQIGVSRAAEEAPGCF